VISIIYDRGVALPWRRGRCSAHEETRCLVPAGAWWRRSCLGVVKTCLALAGRAEELQRQTALRMNRTAMVREKRGRLLLAIRQTYHVRPCPSSRAQYRASVSLGTVGVCTYTCSNAVGSGVDIGPTSTQCLAALSVCHDQSRQLVFRLPTGIEALHKLRAMQVFDLVCYLARQAPLVSVERA